MTEDELKPGAVIQLSESDQPLEIRTAVIRRDGTWVLMGAGHQIVIATKDAIRNARILKPAKPVEPVVSEGRLTVPLYHGTNSVWYESIFQHGLGGRNVIAELGVIELLQELLAIAADSGFEDPPGKIRYAAECIATQKVGVEGWNYRHGTTYFCASAMKAAAYTSDRRCGSEAIDCCLSWVEMIREKDSKLLAPLSDRLEPLLAIAAREAVRLVLEVRDIPIDILRDERGGDPSDVLKTLSEIVTWHPRDLAILGQNVIVESIGTIPANCITTYTLGPNYQLYAPNVDLVPWPQKIG